jgi:probable rRNA maturation factor
MLIDLITHHPDWTANDIAPVAERAACATLAHFGLDPARWEIGLLACDDSRIATLNADFRGKPQPTNVLSWPAADLAPETPGAAPPLPVPDGDEASLGDIAIAYETCAREAEAAGKSMDDHVSHLVVHAVLHLLGYDHVRDQDATMMEATEIAILGKLGISDPY